MAPFTVNDERTANTMSGNIWIAIGAVFASLAVAAGAIGTHVLKETVKLEAAQLETFETAVRYQMYHALGLILVGLLAQRSPNLLLTLAGAGFLFGILLFSGGIYAWMATGVRTFIMIVPVGGSAWILSWLVLAAGALAMKKG
jgi:uncharacterized membrane protein YgdD (TMEM256/DUF423 family)